MGFNELANKTSAVSVGKFANADASVGSETVRCIYDAPYRAQGVYEGEVATTSPAITLTAADSGRLGLAYGVALSINHDVLGVVGNFTVAGMEPDGAGLIRIILLES